MRKMLIGSLLFAGLVLAGHTLPSCDPPAAEGASRAIETRIAIKSCEGLYSSQRDFDACLRRILPPNS